MSDDKVVVRSGGISLCGVLFIVFLLLKLGIGNTVVQTWSWWWVTAPLWGPFVLVLGVAMLVFAVIAIIGAIGIAISKIGKS